MHIHRKRIVEQALYRLKYFLPPAILFLVIVLGTVPSVHAYERELLFRNEYHIENLTNAPFVRFMTSTDSNIYSAIVPYADKYYEPSLAPPDIDPDPDNVVTISGEDSAIVKYSDRGDYLKHVVTFPYKSLLKPYLAATDSNVYGFYRVMYNPIRCGQDGYYCAEQLDVDPGPDEVMVTLTAQHAYLIIVTLDPDLNYKGHNILWDLSANTTSTYINDIQTDSEGNLYYAGVQRGLVDFDLGSGVSEISCEAVQCAVFAKYNPNLELEYVYSWQTPQPVWVHNIHFQDDYVYLGIPLNAVGSYTLDMDPTPGGTDQKEFFEHSSAIVKLNKNGDYVWSHILTSLDLVGQYPFIDDDYYSASTVDTEGNVYVCSYIESDAVNFAGETFEATSTASNKGDLFIYRLNSDGSENWGKMFNPEKSNGWADCSFGGFYNPFEDSVTFGGAFLDTALDGKLNSGAKQDAHILTISPDGSEYNFNHLYEAQDSDISPWIAFYPHSSDDQFKLYITIDFYSAADNNTLEGNLYGETFNNIVVGQYENTYRFLGWQWYEPDQDTSPSKLTKTVKKTPSASNPNIKDGWKHPIMAGPSFIGTHGFVPNINITFDVRRLASVFIDRTTHRDDLYIHHSVFGWLNILAFWNNPDEVKLPWTQGFNAVSEISKIEAKASFNGYPVTETDNPFIILLGYDSNKVGNIPKEQLKIARFNEITKKWETIKGEYVYPDGKIATVTNKFGYFSVVYPRSYWGR